MAFVKFFKSFNNENYIHPHKTQICISKNYPFIFTADSNRNLIIQILTSILIKICRILQE